MFDFEGDYDVGSECEFCKVLNVLSGFMNTKVFILILKFGVSKCFVFFEKFIIYSVRMV